ncbi:hypothetical protein CYMTET_55418 [Cymbomonas tetramitiformis]|uniref:Uncharacterized protein n=1 Tax=Cymbomonas tetramitiformis TaxID=36881 RepID=A0AAE0BDD1_9CHLO|nr:hypothetical protein CYMTET_55418 [Cymbomonas tetramitiformis]
MTTPSSPSTPKPQSTLSELDTAIPLGREDDVEASHVLNEELGLIMGPREGSQGEGSWTDDEWEAFLAMLREEKDFMSTTATDLPGYTGAVGPFEIPFLDETKSSFQKPRRYSPAERELIDEHFNKLLAAGIITKAPHYCKNTCNVVVAMKKALDGTWTDKRVALDLRGVNELSSCPSETARRHDSPRTFFTTWAKTSTSPSSTCAKDFTKYPSPRTP